MIPRSGVFSSVSAGYAALWRSPKTFALSRWQACYLRNPRRIPPHPLSPFVVMREVSPEIAKLTHWTGRCVRLCDSQPSQSVLTPILERLRGCRSVWLAPLYGEMAAWEINDF